MKLKIYVASSWRNAIQPKVVELLRGEGHEVYDFRNPHPTGPDRGRRGVGFSWSEIDPNWQKWTAAQYRDALKSEVAVDGFNSDLDAIKWCDVLVMVQPCGRSSALELGFACGMQKPCAVLLAEGQEPELMLSMADNLCADVFEMLEWVRFQATPEPIRPPGLAPERP